MWPPNPRVENPVSQDLGKAFSFLRATESLFNTIIEAIICCVKNTVMKNLSFLRGTWPVAAAYRKSSETIREKSTAPISAARVCETSLLFMGRGRRRRDQEKTACVIAKTNKINRAMNVEEIMSVSERTGPFMLTMKWQNRS